MLVNEFLEKTAVEFPEKTAMVCAKSRFTYLEVEQSANRFAHGLLSVGLKRHDRATIYLENSAESVVSIFSILKAGGVFVVINPQVKANKIEHILNDCQSKVLITDKKRFKATEHILKNCPYLISVVITDEQDFSDKSYDLAVTLSSYPEMIKRFSEKRPPQVSIDIDLACLIYTSGSTGIPKGVMCTHQNVVAAANSITQYLENTPDDIVLNVLPLSFDYGLYQVLMVFKFRGTLVLEKNFIYPYVVIDLLISEKITGFPLVPTIATLLTKLKGLEKYDFSNLRYITNTAQALPPRHIFQLQKVFPKSKIYSMYGLTECKRVSYLPPEDLEKRPTSVGKAMPNTEVYIVDKEGNKVKEPGVVGELVVRGANVMKGYWNLPEETEKVYRAGPFPNEKVLYTGDYFRMDEEGFLYFISRMDDMIKTGGERVSPKEIENSIYQMENVTEVAVIGVEDEILGRAVKAFVTLCENSDLTEKDIIKYCSKHMENFMVPKYVEILDSMPKSAHGKINKKELT